MQYQEQKNACYFYNSDVIVNCFMIHNAAKKEPEKTLLFLHMPKFLHQWFTWIFMDWNNRRCMNDYSNDIYIKQNKQDNSDTIFFFI